MLSDSELEKLMLESVKGSVDAVSRVTRYYALKKNDMEKAIYWDEMGAENGHLVSQWNTSYNMRYGFYYAYMTVSYYKNITEEYMYIRSIFWLYGLAVIGYNEGKETSNPLKSLEYEGYTLETARPPSDEMFPYNYATLNGQELEECVQGALRGSGKAALILGQYYNGIVKDADSGEYWYRIGAQNGNVECQRQYGNILLGKSDMLDQERGKFWLARAVVEEE